MITGKLDNGFEFSVREDAEDDWELLEAYRKAEEGNGGAAVDVANQLLGEEQKRRLVEHLKKDGRTKATDMMDAIEEILNSSRALKN